MNGLLKSLAASRRSLLGSILAAPIWFGISAHARKRGKGKPRPKAKPNEFGCLNVGSSCKRASQCCSGICQGKNGKKRCRAHDSGSCRAGNLHEVCGGEDVSCVSSAGEEGICTTTTGNAGYCAAGGTCHACRTDADCQAAYGGAFGPAAACAQCELCESTGGTVCVFPKRLPETVTDLTTFDPSEDIFAARRATPAERS